MSLAAQAQYARAQALLAANDVQGALESFQRAFELDPQQALDRRPCLDVFRFLRFEALPDFWHGDLLRFLRRDDVDRFRYTRAALNVLLARPEFREACAGGAAGGNAAALDKVMRDPLFQLVLADGLVADPGFELLLISLRRRAALDPAFRQEAPIDFLASLALQCVTNEHIYAESPEEAQAVDQLKVEADPRALAVRAMYRPLGPGAGPAGAPEPIARLWQRAVHEREEERRLEARIPSVGGIEDPVSREVRAQYEANPYPRWLCFDRYPAVDAAQWIAGEVPGGAAVPDTPAVLVAGCGTGMETAVVAAGVRGVRITGVDLSRASLAYGARMARALGFEIRLLQADILGLDALDERFDVILSSGVLHHMADPAAGLRALARRARPGGLLRIGFYTKLGRGDVNAARQLAAERSLGASPASIRALRSEVFAAPKDSPLRGLAASRDFYSMSECRDLLFHVQERQIAPAEVPALFASAGLELLGLSGRMPPSCFAAYRTVWGGEAGIHDLARWQAVEEKFPGIFRGMLFVWGRAARSL